MGGPADNRVPPGHGPIVKGNVRILGPAYGGLVPEQEEDPAHRGSLHDDQQAS